MDVAQKLAKLETKRTVLTAFGGLGTFGYLCLLALLTDWSKLFTLDPNNVGDFLAGAFAPLAFLWLVIGYFLQAIELKQNSESLMQQAAEMKNAVEHAAEQAQALRASELHAKHARLNDVRIIYSTDLGLCAAEIYPFMLNFPPFADRAPPYGKCMEAFSAGDKEAFIKPILNLCLATDGVKGYLSLRLREHRIVKRAWERYQIVFDDLHRSLDTLEAGAHLRLFFDNSYCDEFFKYLTELDKGNP